MVIAACPHFHGSSYGIRIATLELGPSRAIIPGPDQLELIGEETCTYGCFMAFRTQWCCVPAVVEAFLLCCLRLLLSFRLYPDVSPATE